MDKIMYFADATCDLPVDFIKKHNIQIIGLRYQIGGADGWYTTANKKQTDEFYQKMRKGENASTSLVLYDDAAAAFEPFFRDGYDIIHFGLSSGLAKTWENANNAGNDLSKKYGRKFYAPDTKCVSAMHLLLIEYCISIGEFDKIIEQTPQFHPRIRAFFTVDDLKYLHKSGRLSAAAKIIGGMLHVKPIITTDADGKLSQITRKTGRLTSLHYLAEQVSKIDPAAPKVFIIHADCRHDAEQLEKIVKQNHVDVTTQILDMGFIIGCHTGPGTIGLGFLGA
jgi:DegV family protein with EDD domain